MAQEKIRPDNGKYHLRGPKETDLEGIDVDKYEVFTETEKLAKAERDYPANEGWTWFVSYTIKENGNDVRELPEYTMTFNKPDKVESKLYYYLPGSGNNKGTVHEVGYDEDTDKKRGKAKLRVGDPPNGFFP